MLYILLAQPTQYVIVEQSHDVRLAIHILELIKDFDDGHCQIPSCEGGGVGHLNCAPTFSSNMWKHARVIFLKDKK